MAAFEEKSMALFIGWSGNKSKKIAKELKAYILKVNPYIVPYVSFENIAPGKIWSKTLSEILQASHYGVLCMTPDNLEAHWLYYEAGILAMATSLNNPDREPRIAPLLFGVEHAAKLLSPLSHYQSAHFSEEKLLDLIQEANEICIKLYGEELLTLGSKGRMERAFLFPEELQEAVKKHYPELQSKIEEILKSESSDGGDGGTSGGGNDGGGNGAPDGGSSGSNNALDGSNASEGGNDGTLDSTLLTLLDKLKTIYEQFGRYPDVARIYFEGRQLIDLLRDKKANQEDKKADLQRFLDILKATMNDLDRPEGSTEQRKARSQTIKELAKCLENLLV